MTRTIYILLYTKLAPETKEGRTSGLWEDATDDRTEAEELFRNLPLNHEYYRKELWLKEPNGTRSLLMEEKFDPYATKTGKYKTHVVSKETKPKTDATDPKVNEFYSDIMEGLNKYKCKFNNETEKGKGKK